MDKLKAFADPNNYLLWIELGIIALAIGWFLGGWADMFAEGRGGFLRQSGGVLIASGMVLCGVTADHLPNGLRLCAVICAGLLGCAVF